MDASSERKVAPFWRRVLGNQKDPNNTKKGRSSYSEGDNDSESRSGTWQSSRCPLCLDQMRRSAQDRRDPGGQRPRRGLGESLQAERAINGGWVPL